MVELLEKIVRQRIYDSFYWKRDCFGLNAASICDKCANLTAVGGLQDNHRATPFLCLVFKLTLINPPREIIEEMLSQKYFKYLTAVALVFVRLTYDAMLVYRIIEPFLGDYRKLRCTNRSSSEFITHIDELAESLLYEEQVFDITLPRLPPRIRLEDLGLEPREPLIEDELIGIDD